jgi:hypothetical protein
MARSPADSFESSPPGLRVFSSDLFKNLNITASASDAVVDLSSVALSNRSSRSCCYSGGGGRSHYQQQFQPSRAVVVIFFYFFENGRLPLL